MNVGPKERYLYIKERLNMFLIFKN